MDEKSRAKAQLEHPRLADKPSNGPWLKVAIGVALAAALGWGVVLGIGSLHARKPGPPAPAAQPTPAAPAAQPAATPPGGSVNQTVEAQSALDAYRPYLKFHDVTADYEEDLLEGDVPVVRGKLENAGSRTLAFVEMTAYFLNADGKRIHEQRFPMVGALINNLTGIGEAPLRPGYIQSFEFKASDTPSEWAKGKVEVEVTGIRFGPDANAPTTTQPTNPGS